MFFWGFVPGPSPRPVPAPEIPAGNVRREMAPPAGGDGTHRGIWDEKFGMRDWDQGFGIGDLGYRMRDLGFGRRDPGFGIRSLG